MTDSGTCKSEGRSSKKKRAVAAARGVYNSQWFTAPDRKSVSTHDQSAVAPLPFSA